MTLTKEWLCESVEKLGKLLVRCIESFQEADSTKRLEMEVGIVRDVIIQATEMQAKGFSIMKDDQKMTDRERMEKEHPKFNSRYLAYCFDKGINPEKVLGINMSTFMYWMSEKKEEFKKIAGDGDYFSHDKQEAFTDFLWCSK